MLGVVGFEVVFIRGRVGKHMTAGLAHDRAQITTIAITRSDNIVLSPAA